MGWKSTFELSRRAAIDAIQKAVDTTPYDKLSNEELENLMYELNIGDDTKFPYYGYNFRVVDNEENINNGN